MEFENPTESICGKRQSVQGFSVYEKYGVVLFHTGIAAVYDLEAKKSAPLGAFRLGSYDAGCDKRYINHANDCVFGQKIEGERFPLLYVTAGNSGETDEKGFISYCAVEQFYEKNGEFSAKTVQRIYYKNDGIESTLFETPGWGWPAYLPDGENGFLYLFSARQRTRKGFSGADNRYIVTKFRLPDPGRGDVTLCPKDIIDQFLLPFDVYFTQGGTIYKNILWYTFGCGNAEHPNALRAVDLERKEFVLSEDLSDTQFLDDEVECCGFFSGRLLINTQSGKIYERIQE